MDDRERNKDNFIVGVSPIKYRLVFEMEDFPASHKKGPDGSIEMKRMEFFVEDERSFFFINGILGTLGKVTRAEAVILEDGTTLKWADRNPGEEE